MMSFLYNFALVFLTLIFFPKFLADFLFKKKYRKSLKRRLLPKTPNVRRKKVIWLHGVSVGEIKALSTLIPHIRKSASEAFIFVTTVTETGYAEGKRILKNIDEIQYLPLDFPWAVKSFVKALNPSLLVLVEGDYWMNLMREVKKCGGKTVVVNGKLSQKSLKRYLAFRPFAETIFSSIDLFCLQGESYLKRFLELGIPPEKLSVTGNLKFDIPYKEKVDPDTLRKEFGIGEKDTVITAGSTHDGEEKLIFKAVSPLLEKDPHLKILIVPRHPERFKRVKELFTHPQVKVVDKMGVLASCYRISNLAIVGGSFVKGVGGHDLFEPARMGVPTIYGPYVHKQVDYDQMLSDSGGGVKLAPQELQSGLSKLILNPTQAKEIAQKGKNIAQKALGVSFRTWNFTQSNISLEKN